MNSLVTEHWPEDTCCKMGKTSSAKKTRMQSQLKPLFFHFAYLMWYVCVVSLNTLWVIKSVSCLSNDHDTLIIKYVIRMKLGFYLKSVPFHLELKEILEYCLIIWWIWKLSECVVFVFGHYIICTTNHRCRLNNDNNCILIQSWTFMCKTKIIMY